MLWNDTEGTLDIGLKRGNVNLFVGAKQVVQVINKTATNLLASNYQVVKIDGAQGQRLKVALAQANNDANSADTIGLVHENINNNQEGWVCTSGIMVGLNTTGSLQGETWNDGDILYLSGTTAGRVTNIKPSAPTHTVIVGFVVYAHANNGKIYVKVDNGYELDELHNVRITSVANNNVLRYNSTSSVWENIPQTSLDAGTVTNGVYTTGNQTIGGTKTFSSTISGSISGNAGTVTNGVYTTGNQTIAGDKTFSGTTALASTSTIGGAVIGYRDVPVTISNAATTFALADAGKAFGKDNGTAYTYTIPANGTVAFPIGTVITVFNNNATSNNTVAITTDTLRLAGTTTTGSRTVAPFALCTLFKVSSTVWMASGAGVT